MEISITGRSSLTATADTTLVLADLAGQSAPGDGLGFTGDGDYQPVRYARGGGLAYIYRGNESTRMQFNVLKEFANFPAAEAWLLDHRANMPKGGTVILRSAAGDLAPSTKRGIPNCKVAVDIKPMGSSHIVTYTIEGGPIQNL